MNLCNHAGKGGKRGHSAKTWVGLVFLGLMIGALPSPAESAAKLPSLRLSETVPAGSSLRQLAEGNHVLAATLAKLRTEAEAKGSVRVAVKTAVAFAPEKILPESARLAQRREIAAAAQSLRKAMPKATDFEALEDMPYVLLQLDTAGLAMLESVPGLVRIVRADAFNWRRDYISTRQEALAAALPRAPGGGDDSQPPRAAIVNGKVADPGTHPFMVGLMVKNIKDNFVSRFCGGTLVSPTHVVTAAHCVDEISAANLDVLVGARRLDGSGRRVGVTRIYLPPGTILGESSPFDAAVVELAEPVTGIRFATLASRQPTVPGEMLRLTGWGDQSPISPWDGGESDFPVDLMQTDLPYRLANPYDIASVNCFAHRICVGGNGISNICSGDSGGPVTINRGAGYTELVGIISGMHTCQADQFPAHLVNVAHSEVNSFIRNIVFAPPKSIAFSAISRTVGEGEKTVTLTLQRAATDSVAQVNFATANGTAIFRPDAFFRSDYWAGSGTVTFWRGQSRADITITLVDDKVKEGSEFFTVRLSKPSAGWSLSGNGIGIVTITDND